MKVQFASSKRHSPDVDSGLKVNYAPGKRATSKASWYLIVAIVCSPLFYFVYNALGSALLVTAPGYVTLEKYQLNSAGEGRIAQLLVQPGDRVEKGQVVARLQDVKIQAEIVRLQSEIEAIKARPIDSTSYLQRRYAIAQQEFEHQRAALDKMNYLFDLGAATQAEVNGARSGLRRSQIAEVEAREAMNSAALAPDISPRAAAALAGLEAKLGGLQATQDNLVQRAPVSGRVLDVFVKQNQFVAMAENLLLLGAIDSVMVTGYIDPKNAKYAELGQTAEIALPSSKRVTGTIVELPELTQRLPAEFVGPLGLRRLKILARFEFEVPLAESARVDGLPVQIHFPFKL